MPSADKGGTRPPVVFLVGPTGAGKSALAAALALRRNGEIVSADSRLLYRGFDIGTDKPSLAVRARVPHHLIDVTDADHPWSLAEYQSAARDCITQIRARGRLPLCVGGTGQYIFALVEGWDIPPAAPTPELRNRLEQRATAEGSAALYGELAGLDPAAAAKIDPRNARRVIRALEVVLSTGKPFSAQRTRGEISFQPFLVGVNRPRPELYALADARIDRMFQAGWVEEVRTLLEKGYSPRLPAFSALGYAPIVRYLQGELTLEECVVEIRRATRVLIRHQANWFRPDDPQIHWLPPGPGLEDRAEQLIDRDAIA
jgi:tRNA dimethylallyltransferase